MPFCRPADTCGQCRYARGNWNFADGVLRVVLKGAQQSWLALNQSQGEMRISMG